MQALAEAVVVVVVVVVDGVGGSGATDGRDDISSRRPLFSSDDSVLTYLTLAGGVLRNEYVVELL